MKKSKKRLFLITAFIILIGYYSKDYKYNKSKYNVIDNGDAYAEYSDGLVYIGDDKFLEKVKCCEKDILICDQRDSDVDPDMIVYDSCLIDDKEKRNEILEILCEYEKCNPSNWNRSIESMRLEWFMHNLGYYFNVNKERTAHVDLDNDDEKKYDNKLIRKILKL